MFTGEVGSARGLGFADGELGFEIKLIFEVGRLVPWTGLDFSEGGAPFTGAASAPIGAVPSSSSDSSSNT